MKELEARKKGRDGNRIWSGSRHEGRKRRGGGQFRIETKSFQDLSTTTVNKDIYKTHITLPLVLIQVTALLDHNSIVAFLAGP